MTLLITRIEIELRTTDTKTVDTIVKKILNALNEKELEVIKKCNILKGMAVIEAT